VRALALLWGLAEATLFFIVPDVLITAIALRSRRDALIATAYACIGAVIGGAITYVWAQHAPVSLHTAFDWLPAISPELIDRVPRDLIQLGWITMFIGPFSGVPYKLFAAGAATAGLSLPMLLLLTIPARAIRFVLLAVVVSAGATLLRRRLRESTIRAIWAAVWCINYAVYWSLMPN
jgi:membrane protein YqaA with SNARE-associated domain